MAIMSSKKSFKKTLSKNLFKSSTPSIIGIGIGSSSRNGYLSSSAASLLNLSTVEEHKYEDGQCDDVDEDQADDQDQDAADCPDVNYPLHKSESIPSSSQHLPQHLENKMDVSFDSVAAMVAGCYGATSNEDDDSNIESASSGRRSFSNESINSLGKNAQGYAYEPLTHNSNRQSHTVKLIGTNSSPRQDNDNQEQSIDRRRLTPPTLLQKSHNEYINNDSRIRTNNSQSASSNQDSYFYSDKSTSNVTAKTGSPKRTSQTVVTTEQMEASAQRKGVIDSYVKRVIANPHTEQFVSPSPHMQRTGNGTTTASTTTPPRSQTSSSLLPLPGFDEIGLLKRAMDRRTLLHDRILAMETVSAELRSDNERNVDSKRNIKSKSRIYNDLTYEGSDSLRERDIRSQEQNSVSMPSSVFERRERYKDTSMRHPPKVDDEFVAGSSTNHMHDRMEEKQIKNESYKQTNEIMDELSKRIKQEALKFLTLESQLASNENDDYPHRAIARKMEGLEKVELSTNIKDGENNNSATKNEDGNSNFLENDKLDDGKVSLTRPRTEDDRLQSDRTKWSSASISTSSNFEPSLQQLSRYSNMVRLGIPDMVILRSMERDGMTTAQSNTVLDSVKNNARENHFNGTSPATVTQSQSLSDRQNIWQKKEELTLKTGQVTCSESDSNNLVFRKNVMPPLKDDPNYNKYFKMLKAKVPRSWVKRVLEVDGKDARVLDLDPERSLIEQVDGTCVDKDGNFDWDKVAVVRIGSDVSIDSSDSGIALKNKTMVIGSERKIEISADTAASVRKELEAMTERVGQLSKATTVKNYQSKISSATRNSSHDMKEHKDAPTAADISSAVAAASNARLDRLKAILDSSGTDGADPNASALGRRRQNEDEIRRKTVPLQKVQKSTSSPSSVASSERTSRYRAPSYDHLPLKDDPRFAKYFQMIRSRVPRSWVERVIEVDDRDPAILDLDPNKSLASQIKEDDVKDILRSNSSEVDVTDTTFGSLDESEHSDVLRNISDLRPNFELSLTTHLQPIVVTKRDEVMQIEKEDLNGEPPIIHIINEANDDERSIASSITNFRDANSNSEQFNIDLSRISAFLDRIESKTKDFDTTSTANRDLPCFANTNDIEKRIKSLIQKFRSRNATLNEIPNDIPHDQQDMMERNQSDKAILSAMLVTELGQPIETQRISTIEQTNELEQFDLVNLTLLLNEVLHKMEKSLPNKETPEREENDSKIATSKSLESLFGHRDSSQEGIVLRDDPEYKKYFKLLHLGLPRSAVIQAMERDGKDTSILDFDPDVPLSEQKNKRPHKHAALESLIANRAIATKRVNKTLALKDDPEYQKYFKMLKIGMPLDTVKQALERDGKDPLIAEMDPEKPFSSEVKSKCTDRSINDTPIKDDPDYAKFFKMLAMGIPVGAVEQALQKEGKDICIARMDPEKSFNSQLKTDTNECADVPIKNHPDYDKFFKMQKMGIPVGAIKQALQKEGKDPRILDMDPDKSYSDQAKKMEITVTSKAVSLKEDPEYAKFFKMLKMGIPVPAIEQALQKEGKDPNILKLDPEKPLKSQQDTKINNSQMLRKSTDDSKVARKRLHWNKIDESKLHEKTFWNQAKEHASLKLVGLDIDNEEFASLFTSPVNTSVASKKGKVGEVKKPSIKQKVQLIDGRRRMNGSILLTKFKVDYKMLAKHVDNMELIEADGNEIRGMIQLLPTKDEALALRSYLPPADAPQTQIEDAIDKLGECEQYMAVMLDVLDVKEKFQCMLFRAEFEQHINSIRESTKLLIDACNSVKNSDRFRKVLVYALKLGNALNTGGSNEEVTAITLDSLLKLSEAKAFDQQTSVLHYLVSIVQKNDEDVLNLSQDFLPVKAAERVAVDMLSQQLKELSNGIKLLKTMVKKYSPCKMLSIEDSIDNIPEDELLSALPIGKFALSAESKVKSLSNEFDNAKIIFNDLLDFFGEDATLSPEAFFCTLNTFVLMFDKTHKDIKQKEEAKERRLRIDEKKRLRRDAVKNTDQ